MNHFKSLILLLCIAFSSSALADLKTYDVDPSNGDEIYRALAGVLAPREGVSYGSISRLPTGQLLIDATPEMHQQIAGVLDSVSRYRAEPTPRVTLQYWAVLGTRGASNASDIPPSLASVLGEIRQVHGPLSFHLLGNAGLVSDSGQPGSSEGEMSVRQTAYVQGDTLNADLQISLRVRYERTVERVGEDGARISTPTSWLENTGMTMNLSMQRGEFVVVGENTVSNDFVTQTGVDGTIFYIVHWPAAN